MNKFNKTPHGKAIRVQVGGMRGLFSVLKPDVTLPDFIADINGLLQTAKERFGALEDLPFSGIMPEIAAYEVKRRSRRSKDEDK